MSDFDVKLVIVGDSGCGKTALLQRLVTGRFARDLPPTYGAEFGAKRIEVEAPDGSGRPCRPSIGVWDASGAPRFHALSRRCAARVRAAVASAADMAVTCTPAPAASSLWPTAWCRRSCAKLSCTRGLHDTPPVSTPCHACRTERFLRGADAVLVCWDPTSRASWDSLRAWVADARAEEPGAHIFLAAAKADLVEAPGQPGGAAGAAGGAAGGAEGASHPAISSPAGGSQPVPAGASVARSGGTRQLGLHLSVSVEHWPGGQAGSGPFSDEPLPPPPLEQQQQQQQQQRGQRQREAVQQGTFLHVPPALQLSPASQAAAAAETREGGDGKPAGPGSSSRAGETPPPATPVTPARTADRPQSPADEQGLPATAPGGQAPAGAPAAASGRVSPAEQVAAEHAAAAAAELVASLTGQEIPSPFAAMAGGPHSGRLSPSPSPGPHQSSDVSQQASGAVPPHSVRWASPELSPQSTPRSVDDWEGAADLNGAPQASRAAAAAAAAQAVAQPQPQAVPPAAVDAYCRTQGGTASSMMRLSARTGEGVVPAFARITQAVLDTRWSQQRALRTLRVGEQRQTAEQRGGQGALPRRSATAGGRPQQPLGGSTAAAAAGPAARQRPRSAGSLSVAPMRTDSRATGVSETRGSSARARSASPSPSPGDDSWARQYCLDAQYFFGGSPPGRQARGPEEQSCRIA